MDAHGDSMGDLVPLDDDRILDIWNDSQAIHDVLSGIADDAKNAAWSLSGKLSRS